MLGREGYLRHQNAQILASIERQRATRLEKRAPGADRRVAYNPTVSSSGGGSNVRRPDSAQRKREVEGEKGRLLGAVSTPF